MAIVDERTLVSRPCREKGSKQLALIIHAAVIKVRLQNQTFWGGRHSGLRYLKHSVLWYRVLRHDVQSMLIHHRYALPSWSRCKFCSFKYWF